MAREKVTLTLDRSKARTAMTLTASDTMSQVVDIALDRLIHAEQLRRDIATYTKAPLDDDELELLRLPIRLDLDDDDVDYDALYGKDQWQRR
jgi:hypothetical protein